MTRPFLRAISRQAFLSLLTVYLVSSAHLKVNKRSPTEELFDGPCFANSGEGPTVLRSWKESLEDLKTRTSGLKLDAELLKDFLKEQYYISDEAAKMLDLMHWLNQEDLIISESVVNEVLSNPKEAFRFQYHVLSAYGLYVKQLRTNGTLAVKKNEEEIRKKLNNFEIKLYSCLCSLKIALQSSGTDVSSIVTSDILDPIFKANSSPLTNAIYRAYITMQDGIDLMAFLNIIYQKIDVSSMKTMS